MDREFLFVGRLCLDFAHTGAVENWRRVWESFRAPEDLSRWLAASSLRLSGLQATADDLAAARALREALLELVDARIAGLPLPADAVAVLNGFARRQDLAPELLTAESAGLADPTVAQALTDVARDAVHLFGSVDQLARMRECASDDCGVVIYDSSRPGRRRWCTRCVDRVRARAYRARHRSTKEPQ